MLCPFCGIQTEIQFAKIEYREPSGKLLTIPAIWKKNEHDNWWIGVCNRCESPVLVLNQCERIYPNSLPTITDSRIPDPMREDLIEAKTCYNASAFRGCAVLARRALQSTCIEKGIKNGDLVHQLNKLKEIGVITNNILEWATVVRWIANDAAHPNKNQVTKDDAEDILNLCEQFLHVIYVAPAIANEQKLKKGK